MKLFVVLGDVELGQWQDCLEVQAGHQENLFQKVQLREFVTHYINPEGYYNITSWYRNHITFQKKNKRAVILQSVLDLL